MADVTQADQAPKRPLPADDETEDTAKKAKTGEEPAPEKTNELCHRRKCALLVSYCGTGYSGMQINPDVKTIEEDLINAIHKAGAINDEVKDSLHKMFFQRAARTDKGVSAARQVVSLKMIPQPSLIPVINEHLPAQIRVMGLKRTTKAFDSKGFCTGRTYKYLLPTYGFAQEYKTTTGYRMTEEKQKFVNEILSVYLGTHNFHNFTSGKKFQDPSAMRYIMELKCGEPFERRGVEFVELTIQGQSFVLNQIRKMIGLAIAIARKIVPISTIDVAWQKAKVDIPKAPALGLYLDKVHYRVYNLRFGNDGIHEPIDWDEHEEEVARFKEEFICKHIIDTEVQEQSMMRWLRSLPEHTYGRRAMDQVGNDKETKNEERPSDDRGSAEDAADSTESQTQVGVPASNSETATNGGKTVEEPPCTKEVSGKDRTGATESQTQVGVPASNSETATNGGKTIKKPPSTEEVSGKDRTGATESQT